MERFAQYERRFTWDNEGKELTPLSGSAAIRHLPLVLITHDETTFYQNDQRQVYWGCPGKNVTPRPKGEGVTLMFPTSSHLSGALCVTMIGAPSIYFFTLKFAHSHTVKPGNIPAWEEQGRLVHSQSPACPGRRHDRHFSKAHRWTCAGTFHLRQCTQPPEICRRCTICSSDGQRCVTFYSSDSLRLLPWALSTKEGMDTQQLWCAHA